MMAGAYPSKPGNQQRRVRQQGAVPFLWEEKPGKPKKEWKPHSQATTVTTLLHPAKLVASVPFKWEEKPGKPLPGFSQPEPESRSLNPSPLKLSGFPYLSILSSSTSSSITASRKTSIFQWESADDEEEEGGTSELDLDSLWCDTDESIAVPVQQTPVRRGSSQNGTPTSPSSETDSNASSYATGRTSLVGASFLECLFPLISTDCDVDFGSNEKNASPEQQTKEPSGVSKRNLPVRRTPTLGELILMSRKRSCNWNPTQTRKKSLALGLVRKSAFGCCFFGPVCRRIDNSSRGRMMQMLKPHKKKTGLPCQVLWSS